MSTPATQEIISEHGALTDACKTYDEALSALLHWADDHSHYGRDERSQEHRRAIVAMLDKSRWLSRGIVLRSLPD